MPAARISLRGPLLACIGEGSLAFAAEQNNLAENEGEVMHRPVEDGLFLHHDTALMNRIKKTRKGKRKSGKIF